MAYLRPVFALIACKEASLFGVDSCSGTSVSTFYKLLEIERHSKQLERRRSMGSMPGTSSQRACGMGNMAPLVCEVPPPQRAPAGPAARPLTIAGAAPPASARVHPAPPAGVPH
jgi:hypothetical protein